MKLVPMVITILYETGAEDLVRQVRSPYIPTLDFDMHKRTGPDGWWTQVEKPKKQQDAWSELLGGGGINSLYGSLGIIDTRPGSVTTHQVRVDREFIGTRITIPRSQAESQYELHSQHMRAHEEEVRAMSNRRESERRAIQSELDRRNAEAAKAKPKTPWAKFRQLF